jgi:hypothetical protein
MGWPHYLGKSIFSTLIVKIPVPQIGGLIVIVFDSRRSHPGYPDMVTFPRYRRSSRQVKFTIQVVSRQMKMETNLPDCVTLTWYN